MFEQIIEAIGRFIAALFRKSGEFIEDAKVEANLMKEQARVSSVNAKSTLSVSFSEGSYVNYFRNRVIGEFLRVMSSVVPYKYEPKSGKYVVYFVRHKRKNYMEYIKFSKDTEESKNVDISYTVINRMMSSTGITSKIGNTSKKVLLVDDAVSSCIYDSISGRKAPLYMLHVLEDKVGVGNPTFVYDCWILTTKIIMKKTVAYINGGTDANDKQMIESLTSSAGIHMFMSYFQSLTNPFYRTSYGSSKINSMASAVKLYNSLHFNTNKILSFTYNKCEKNKGRVEVDQQRDRTTLSLYGAEVIFTGKITESAEMAISRFNYKFAETLLTSDDLALRRNFAFYMFSTGGIDDKDIIQLWEEDEVANSKVSDPSYTDINNRVEPVVKKVMYDSGFKEDDSGELVSKDFSEFIDAEVKQKANTPAIEVPKEVEPVYVEIGGDTKVTEVPSSKDAIAELHNESKSVKDEINHSQKAESLSNENSRGSKDIVSMLRSDAGFDGESVTSRSDNVEYVAPSNSDSSVNKIDKPIISWTFEDCMSALGGATYDSHITKEDIISRMMFLREQGK